MNIFKRFKRLFKNQKSETLTKLKLVTEQGNGVYLWNGKVYDSDIVRACLAPYVKAVGKLSAKHIYNTPQGQKPPPDVYIKILLENPNPYMSAQKYQEKMAAQLKLNGNAFAHITRNENGLPVELYPINAVSVESIFIAGALSLRFTLMNGKTYTFPYEDVIHLRLNFYDNDIFGSSLMPSLVPLLKILNVIDSGIVSAVENSRVIRWLLRIGKSLRDDDVKRIATDFSDTFLKSDSETGGVAVVDAKVEDAKQVDSKDYVPNFQILEHIKGRVYSLFGLSEKIAQGSYTEDEWNAFYESDIEPTALDFSSEHTRKLFSVKKRSYGNKIVFEEFNLSCASLNTKIGFKELVDRGAMTPNEWRATLNLAPLPGGDVPIRRLDTAPTMTTAGGGDDDGDTA